MNGLARTCWIAAPVYVLVGMIFGIWMSASADHTLAPAHAHLNLLGWVTIALYGTFYTLVPQASRSMVAKIQVLLANLAPIALFPGIILAIQGQGEFLAIAGSFVALASMLLFLFVVVRATAPGMSLAEVGRA